MTTAEESKSDNTQLSEDVPTLEAEIVEMTAEKERIIQSIQDLLKAEDVKNGIYHHTEIHASKQEKLRLGVDIQFRTNKINRIKLGIDGMQPGEDPNGFAF
ncbi:MAG: hypothetical protein OCC46_10875 [Pseudodesulfovibrio sp.]